MVLMFHSEHVAPRVLDGVFRQGWIGVELFFVLSGFLISGILWDSRGSKTYFRRFYWRRVLRIWPVYLLILLFAFCIFPSLKWLVGGPVRDIPNEPLGVWAFLLFIQNLFGGQLSLSPMLGTTWSLAIEEQFYFVWPAVLRFVSQRAIMPCLLAGLLLSPFIRMEAAHCGFSQPAIYYNPLTHADGLLCGAVVALWLRSAKPRRRTLLMAGLILLLAGVALFAPIHPVSLMRQSYSPLVYSAIALLSTGLLLLALVSENLGALLHRFFFMNQTLAFFGFISYGLYIYHYPIIRFTMSDKLVARLDWWHHPHLTVCLMAFLGVGLSILAAWASRVTLERAALSRKDLFG